MRNAERPSKVCFTAQFILWYTIGMSTAYAQSQQPRANVANDGVKTDDLPQIMARLKTGEASGLDLEKLGNMKAVQATPLIEQQFASSKDADMKGKIASTLVRLGDKDSTYWDYLVKEAAPAWESDAPAFAKTDDQDGPSAEFVAWAAAHNVTVENAQTTIIELAIKVAYLAGAGDARAIPYLRRTLFSPYIFSQAFAAEGLAALHDKKSIPLMIKACQKSSPAAASVIAASLVYFDDPRAQAAVDLYMEKDAARVLRDGVAEGKTPFGH